MTDAPDAIVTECEFDDPPAKVWRALTEPALVAKWLGANDINAISGARFTLKQRDGDAACEVIDAEPPSLLRYRWRAQNGDGETIDSVVTFTISPTENGGAHLRIVQDEFAVAPKKEAPAIVSTAPILLTDARNRRAAGLSLTSRTALRSPRARAPFMRLAA
ncbi:SRPBCC domain-containing protein [Terrarubrum flagellatum]|uniref:SRPBCC family protein n=1 Tax=Terrirubrum flagellatum TaxID=2895980 RepID=UPI00314556BD